MDNDQFELFMTVLLRIADALERLAPDIPKAPNYQYPIEAFPNFDWESIGAVVEKYDQFGTAVVSWGGQSWMRNVFGAKIWFSRDANKDPDGSLSYERLITFKPRKANVKPIPQKVVNLIA